VTAALQYLVPLVGIAAAYAALGVPRSRHYRAGKPLAAKPRPRPKRRLSDAERVHVLDVLNSDRFADKAPRQVYAEALDDDEYLCSVRTMYRILDENDLVRERRDQRRHPKYIKPEVTARAPNQVWSWDITKVPGPHRGVYYSLYVVLDLYSRFVVGWVISAAESKEVAGSLIAESYRCQNVVPGQLKCHSDRGTPMVARSTALLYADLGITASYSRPRVSNDNPFSEAAFKTLKYRPETPERFGSLADARAFFTKLFDWYNNRHYHTGISLLTPADVHRGRADLIIAARQKTLDAAYARVPERFARRPIHAPVPEATWINPPTTTLS
jgi:transposase InsO family protein